jgi:hypothetical protein
MLIPSALAYQKYTSAGEIAGRDEILHDRIVGSTQGLVF